MKPADPLLPQHFLGPFDLRLFVAGTSLPIERSNPVHRLTEIVHGKKLVCQVPI
jgi:hypothetical protein